MHKLNGNKTSMDFLIVEIVPILMVQGMVLFNAQDFSGLGALFFVYNMTDESDLVIGLLAPWGDKPSVDLNHFDPSSVIKSEFGLMCP